MSKTLTKERTALARSWLRALPHLLVAADEAERVALKAGDDDVVTLARQRRAEWQQLGHLARNTLREDVKPHRASRAADLGPSR